MDARAFPTYDQIITNPMNLVRMEKKNSGDKYTSVGCLLKDAELIRTNAYTFNSDPSDVEVRIMADMFLHYFQYLLRHMLLQFVTKAYDVASSLGRVGRCNYYYYGHVTISRLLTLFLITAITYTFFSPSLDKCASPDPTVSYLHPILTAPYPILTYASLPFSIRCGYHSGTSDRRTSRLSNHHPHPHLLNH